MKIWQIVYISEGRENIDGKGGVRPSLVEGRVKGPSDPVQKHPQPEGHIGTVTSNESQHEI
jgi:hypothetical protein